MNRLLVFSLPLLAAVVFWCSEAFSQDMPIGSPYGMVPDEWSLERITPNHYRLEYWNSEARTSGLHPQFLNMGEMTVDLQLRITSGPEILTVIPPVGWEAMPPQIAVDDGSMGRVEIIRTGEWLGM
jgi:hypothetical protein